MIFLWGAPSMDQMVNRVVARFVAAADDSVQKGDELVVLSRRGKWPPDMYAKGTKMVVVDGGRAGATIKTKPKGDVMTSGHEFTLVKGTKGTFVLNSTNDVYKRALKVQRV